MSAEEADAIWRQIKKMDATMLRLSAILDEEMVSSDTKSRVMREIQDLGLVRTIQYNKWQALQPVRKR